MPRERMVLMLRTFLMISRTEGFDESRGWPRKPQKAALGQQPARRALSCLPQIFEALGSWVQDHKRPSSATGRNAA
jgi:hypothetical protein